MIIGLVGNVIVVAVITTLRKRGQKASVQLFFLHLAISDLMVCLLCIPLTLFTNFNYPTEFHERDIGLCKISRFMQVLELLLCISQFEISTPPRSTFPRKLTWVLELQLCISQFELSLTLHTWHISPHVRKSKTVLDSGLHAVNSGYFVSKTWINVSNLMLSIIIDNRLPKRWRHKNEISEIMGFARIFWQNNVQQATYQKWAFRGKLSLRS